MIRLVDHPISVTIGAREWFEARLPNCFPPHDVIRRIDVRVTIVITVPSCDENVIQDYAGG
jgi:hypothetical protein